MDRKTRDSLRLSPVVAFNTELSAARGAAIAGKVDLAFRHLERAHILGQRRTLEHVQVHWLMLRLGASTGAWREVIGQATRILAAAVFSRIWVPIGNTGRAGVSAMRPMPMPADLHAVLQCSRSGGASWR
jgi:hypothetical protein